MKREKISEETENPPKRARIILLSSQTFWILDQRTRKKLINSICEARKGEKLFDSGIYTATASATFRENYEEVLQV